MRGQKCISMGVIQDHQNSDLTLKRSSFEHDWKVEKLYSRSQLILNIESRQNVGS